MIFYKEFEKDKFGGIEKLLPLVTLQEDVVCLLNSNGYNHDKYSAFEWMLAVGEHKKISIFSSDTNDCFEELRHFYKKYKDWMFGFFSYDLKNKIEKLESNHPDFLNFPDLYFFVPKILFKHEKQNLIKIFISDESYKMLVDRIINRMVDVNLDMKKAEFSEIQSRFTKEDYLQKVKAIKQHIQFGDIYEMNFCQEFFSENAEIDPLDIYFRLNSISQMPFSAFFKYKTKYILSASPERYLRKIGNTIISQPIKGTSARIYNPVDDENAAKTLESNEKERAENIMIVDLVRNDLAVTAKKRSVQVEELCKVYSFPFVHQMISTIKSELHENYDWLDVVKSSFPMGSMTGAPKISAMKIIEKFEKSRRGLYSGAIGYVSRDEDFDFNVVIRTLLYNSENKYLSFTTGSAITIQSNAEKEYEECLLKAEAIYKVLGK